MTDENLQQFALLDILLTNWDGILIRLGPIPETLEKEIAQVAQKLSAAPNTDEIARLLDRLFDLMEETAAYDYVRELIRRSTLPEQATTRGFVSHAAAEPMAAEEVTRAARNFAAAPPSAVELTRIPIFFATNRKPEANDHFGGTYAKELSYGVATVTIPQRHRTGKVERPGWLRNENKERHVVIAQTELLGWEQFDAQLEKEVAAASRRELLVFLHGYQVTFDDAARRAAQVARDINFEGRVVLFSWPSAGALKGYFMDEASAKNSAMPLADFLRHLEDGPWEKVHLVAHSMGNRVLTESLASRAEFNLPLQNIVFIAADVNVEWFDQQFPWIAERVRLERGDLITSYASNSDRALFLSWFLHRSNRIGRFPDKPYVREGMETIDASAIDTSLLGLHHSYFGNKRSVLTDLGSLIGEGLPAAQRHGLRAVERWWEFPR